MNNISTAPAFDKNIQGKFSYLPTHIEHMTVQTINNMLLIDSGLTSNMFNIICCAAQPEPTEVQAAINHFRIKKLPYAFWVGFEHDPFWLEDELLQIGLTTDETEWAMLCDLNKYPVEPVHTHFDIRQVSDHAGIQALISVMNGILPKEEQSAIRTFFERSTAILLANDCPLTFFVGYANGHPISLSSSYCAEGLASIFDVIVLPQMRGQGLGKAMTLQAMLDAQTKGYDKCILTATNDAKYLYQKLGFEDVKTMKVYHESLN